MVGEAGSASPELDCDNVNMSSWKTDFVTRVDVNLAVDTIFSEEDCEQSRPCLVYLER